MTLRIHRDYKLQIIALVVRYFDIVCIHSGIHGQRLLHFFFLFLSLFFFFLGGGKEGDYLVREERE